MKRSKYLFLILIVSVIGFATGFYFKFVKLYTDEKLQVSVMNVVGDNFDKQLKLSETIALLATMESIKDSKLIDRNENVHALKMLNTINIISILTMIVTIIFVFLTTKKLLYR